MASGHCKELETSKVDWVHRLPDLLPLDLLYSSPPGFNAEVDGCK